MVRLSLLACWSAGLLLVLEPLLPLRAEAEKHLEIVASKRLRIVYDYSAYWPRGHGSAALRLPLPPDTGTQSIEHISSSLHGHVETDDCDHRVLIANLSHEPGDDREIHWRVEVIGRFQMRQLVDGPAELARPVASPPAGAFLASTASINWDTDRFQDWLASSGLRRRSGESAVAYGARVFAYLRENGSYAYPPETAWNAAAACRSLDTDCGGFSLVFAAACRANRIPARMLVGQWFKSRGGDPGERQAHVIAEFFDPQIGWIPEDISSTLLRVRGFADTNFFGRDPGYFFAWHVDTDFQFDVPDKPDAKVQWIQNPSLWFSDDAESAAESASHDWIVQALPENFSRAGF